MFLGGAAEKIKGCEKVKKYTIINPPKEQKLNNGLLRGCGVGGKREERLKAHLRCLTPKSTLNVEALRMSPGVRMEDEHLETLLQNLENAGVIITGK